PAPSAEALPSPRGLPAAQQTPALTSSPPRRRLQAGTACPTSACPGAAEAPRSRAARQAPSRSDRTATLEVGEVAPYPHGAAGPAPAEGGGRDAPVTPSTGV